MAANSNTELPRHFNTLRKGTGEKIDRDLLIRVGAKHVPSYLLQDLH
jgi:hypothetical protein